MGCCSLEWPHRVWTRTETEHARSVMKKYTFYTCSKCKVVRGYSYPFDEVSAPIGEPEVERGPMLRRTKDSRVSWKLRYILSTEQAPAANKRFENFLNTRWQLVPYQFANMNQRTALLWSCSSRAGETLRSRGIGSITHMINIEQLLQAELSAALLNRITGPGVVLVDLKNQIFNKTFIQYNLVVGLQRLFSSILRRWKSRVTERLDPNSNIIETVALILLKAENLKAVVTNKVLVGIKSSKDSQTFARKKLDLLIRGATHFEYLNKKIGM